MFRLRLANMSDKIDIKELMNLSISELQKEYLTDEQITASFSIRLKLNIAPSVSPIKSMRQILISKRLINTF